MTTLDWVIIAAYCGLLLALAWWVILRRKEALAGCAESTQDPLSDTPLRPLARPATEILWAALDCPALWSLIFDAPADSRASTRT